MDEIIPGLLYALAMMEQRKRQVGGLRSEMYGPPQSGSSGNMWRDIPRQPIEQMPPWMQGIQRDMGPIDMQTLRNMLSLAGESGAGVIKPRMPGLPYQDDGFKAPGQHWTNFP